GAGDLTHRLPVEGPAEIADLARTFNAMTANLSESFAGLQALLSVSRRLAPSLKLQDVLEAALRAGLEELQATHCALLLCPQPEGPDPVPPLLFLAGPDGMHRGEAVSFGMLPNFARALEMQEVVVGGADGTADPTWTVVVPLTAGGIPLGTMAFALREGAGGLTPSRVSLLRAVANQAAVAVQNAELYERLRGYSENLEHRVEERTRDLTALNQQLQQANRHKSQFLANMSHELRTPLNSIIGFSEVLLDGGAEALRERQRLYVDTILDSGQHLLTLISDILDVAKIEAGKVRLEPAAVHCTDLVAEAVDVVRPQAERKRLRLGGAVEPAGTTVWGDRPKLRQVLLNLLSNAVKFTPDGGEVRVTASPAPGGAVEFRVADTGIGIHPDDQERIFQAFEQVDNSYSRRYQGTGLGLSLTRQLVELHGGTVRVESAVGAGSTFIVTLPAAAMA
ncbi:MAG: HAMP domain-containing protein, partial [candidate division NC10 bacterium]|nr:HAMP domain-containing protein [candidate division NC10 bacterium]